MPQNGIFRKSPTYLWAVCSGRSSGHVGPAINGTFRVFESIVPLPIVDVQRGAYSEKLLKKGGLMVIRG